MLRILTWLLLGILGLTTVIGLAVAAAWVWSLVTGLLILRAARAREHAARLAAPPLPGA